MDDTGDVVGYEMPTRKFSGDFIARSLSFVGGETPKLSLVTQDGHAFVLLSDTQVALLAEDCPAWLARQIRNNREKK